MEKIWFIRLIEITDFASKSDFTIVYDQWSKIKRITNCLIYANNLPC